MKSFAAKLTPALRVLGLTALASLFLSCFEISPRTVCSEDGGLVCTVRNDEVIITDHGNEVVRLAAFSNGYQVAVLSGKAASIDLSKGSDTPGFAVIRQRTPDGKPVMTGYDSNGVGKTVPIPLHPSATQTPQ